MTKLILTSEAFTVFFADDTVPKMVLKIDEPFSVEVSLGMFRTMLDARYPGLVATDPGTEENPLPNGISMTPQEVVVYLTHTPDQLEQIKEDLEHINEYI